MFEPSGVDHQSPGSSFMVGQQLVREIFGAQPPIGPMYAFVGIRRHGQDEQLQGRRTDRRGRVADHGAAAAALAVCASPPQPGVQHLLRPGDQPYVRRVGRPGAQDRGRHGGAGRAIHSRAAGTASGELPTTPRKLPFRTLASVVDITTGDEAQMLRILRDFTRPVDPVRSLDELRPRLAKAEAWVTTYVEPEQRTQVRAEPDSETARHAGRFRSGGAQAPDRRVGGRLVARRAHDAGLRRAEASALPADQAKPTPELKVAQRSFFRCSTSCSSAATPAPGCPRCCSRWARTGSAPCSRLGADGTRQTEAQQRVRLDRGRSSVIRCPDAGPGVPRVPPRRRSGAPDRRDGLVLGLSSW